MILVNISFKSYDLVCTNRDMPLCSKWNVFVSYDSKAAGNLRKVAGFCEVLNISLDVK